MEGYLSLDVPLPKAVATREDYTRLPVCMVCFVPGRVWTDPENVQSSVSAMLKEISVSVKMIHSLK